MEDATASRLEGIGAFHHSQETKVKIICVDKNVGTGGLNENKCCVSYAVTISHLGVGGGKKFPVRSEVTWEQTSHLSADEKKDLMWKTAVY